MSNPVFLGAYWKHLAVLNYEIDPNILLPHLPAGTELDFYEGKTYVSLVAFLFEKTTMFGWLPAFFHRDFEEVNLRFYVLRRTPQGVRRGVVFIKEIVPKPFLAWTARTFYKENYVAMPMSNVINTGQNYFYTWEHHSLKVHTENKLREAKEHSLDRWITEHYWGYTKINQNLSYEYEVKHPIWNLYTVTDYVLKLETASLYGKEFAPVLHHAPSSAFLADGSYVTVHWPTKISRNQQ